LYIHLSKLRIISDPTIVKSFIVTLYVIL